MNKKLRVSLKVVAVEEGKLSGQTVLDFTGDTELEVDELRKVLAHLVAGGDSFKPLFEAAEEKATAAEPLVPATSPAPAKRRKPRAKTNLVCQRCGRPFKGMSVLQKYCHKKDCEVVAASKFVRAALGSPQRGTKKNYPKSRMAPTPRTPAVCVRCGRSFTAYTKIQKYCGKEDCRAVSAQRATKGWTPQATIVAGEGLVEGAV